MTTLDPKNDPTNPLDNPYRPEMTPLDAESEPTRQPQLTKKSMLGNWVL